MTCVLFYVLLSEIDQSHAIRDRRHTVRPIRRARKGVVDFETEDKQQPKVYPKQRLKEKVAPMGIDEAAQATLDYIGENLDVRYNVIGNDGGRFHVDIVFTNAGNDMIPACCWAIYLYHMKYDVILFIHIF